MRLKPAVRIVFAPIALRNRSKIERDAGMHTHGEADKEKRTVYIDPRMSDIGPTLYHELTHIRHPDWDEDRVHAYEIIRWGKMGWREKARIYQLLGSAILKGEEDIE